MLELFYEEQQPSILSVAEYNSLVNDSISSLEIIVQGEITELNIWQNKFAYITLKDNDQENITTSVFGIALSISNIYECKVGDIVQISGSPGIHSKTGRHSLQAKKITLIDEGFYEKRRAELIKKLSEEWIIDESRKRSLKAFNNKIALITAVPSQAYNDFVKIYNDRWGQGSIDVYPTKMQGSDSDLEVINSLNRVYNSGILYDCIVIARGGGSKEDLISFDSEKLARKIFSAPVPVISAIGHEGDISISDLVSDVRASTPTNAAELITQYSKESVFQASEIILQNIYDKVYTSFESLEEIIDRSVSNINDIVNENIEILYDKTNSLEKILKAYDINNTLNRGFSIITNEQDHSINDHNEIEENNIYNIYLKNEKKQQYKLKRI